MNSKTPSVDVTTYTQTPSIDASFNIIYDIAGNDVTHLVSEKQEQIVYDIAGNLITINQ